MSAKFYENERFAAAAERRMYEWEQVKDSGAADSPGGGEIDYITLSRELGSGGEQIAELISEMMGWKVYDKEILNAMAENMDVHVKALESVDEKTIGWINDWLVPLFSGKSDQHVEQLSYFKHLGQVLLIIARHGKAIIVGRAAGLLLPRDRGLSIRITAPFELRCKRYAEQEGIDIEQARILVRKSDNAQKKFVRSFLGKDINAAQYYDIAFNTEKLELKQVAKLVCRALDERALHQQQLRVSDKKEVASYVEEQVSLWEKNRGAKRPEETGAHLVSGAEVDYITITRQLKSGGGQIAHWLADKMGWRLYDQEILNYMADNMRVHVRMLMSVDEKTLNWIGDRLVPFFAKKRGEHLKLRYYEHLGESLLVIAEHGKAVIVGRAAAQVLPRDKGLSVYITAPFELRCQRYAEENKVSMEQARNDIRKADKEMVKFVKDFTGKNVEDIDYYDLVCNTEKIPPLAMAKLIWRTFDQRMEHEKKN